MHANTVFSIVFLYFLAFSHPLNRLFARLFLIMFDNGRSSGCQNFLMPNLLFSFFIMTDLFQEGSFKISYDFRKLKPFIRVRGDDKFC
jgi:hypothetical protein